jgi:hypothetical protein
MKLWNTIPRSTIDVAPAARQVPVLRHGVPAEGRRDGRPRPLSCVRWRLVAFGQELKYFRSQAKPERLFRRATLLGYEGVVHEEAKLSEPGLPRHVFRSPLLHHSRETVRSSLVKLTQYTMLGAAKRAQRGKRGGVLRGLASGLSMFLRLYVLHLGFLCGAAGFLYCVFVSLESFFRYAAMRFDRDQLTQTEGR